MRNRAQNQNRAVKLLLSIVLAALVSRHLLAVLPGLATDVYWYITDVLRPIGMAAALALCATLIPWRMLRLKCLLAALCGYYISDVIVCATWYVWHFPSPVAAFIIQGAGFLAAAIHYWMRSYDQPSDHLEHGYLFSVRHIPSNTQDFMISMSGLYGPDGGYSLYANGYLYKFSSGRLIRRKVLTLPAISYHVTRGAKLDPDLISRLDSMIGMRWSLNKNCLTVLGRIWREHSGRAY
ncbi:hypothetical protein D3C85_920330 [compost metagenome]